MDNKHLFNLGGSIASFNDIATVTTPPVKHSLSTKFIVTLKSGQEIHSEQIPVSQIGSAMEAFASEWNAYIEGSRGVNPDLSTTNVIHPTIVRFIAQFSLHLRAATHNCANYGDNTSATETLDASQTKLIGDIADALHNIAQVNNGKQTDEDGNTYFFRNARGINAAWAATHNGRKDGVFGLLPLPVE